jgi:hypothetical protein
VPSFAERITAVSTALDEARIPYAFGGALSLAFHVGEPRATRDIDVNVFVPPERSRDVFEALPSGTAWTELDVDRVERDGQVRLFWDETPIDLFFSTHEFHDLAWKDLERVPFAGSTIPILGATELVVFKAYFDRPQDWVDIEAMVEAGTPDLHRAIGWLVDLLGPDDHRVARARSLIGWQRGPEPRFDPRPGA